ncbi:MAG: methyl-accepting chemotaxis protein [Spirochaetaceae bacterium]|jgi:methyl-accepting chemotaxis protein|nr:methyl-accepting chemotaxis protein [Spirochaetaceae bacterium]
MKIKFKLIIIVICILLSVVSIVSVLLVGKARTMQVNSATENINLLGSAIATELKEQYETYLQVGIDTAAVLGNFRGMAPSSRRKNIIDNMMSIVETQESIISIYSCWFPNVLEDDDLSYAGTETAGETGQFIPMVLKTSGAPELTRFAEYKTALSELTDAQVVTNPVSVSLPEGDTLAYTIMVPIKSGGSILGLVGIEIDLSATEDYITDYITGNEKFLIVNTIEVIANNGVIVAHTEDDKVGKNLLEADEDVFKGKAESILAGIQQGEYFTMRSYSPGLKTNQFMTFIPLLIGESKTPWTVMVGCAEAVIFEIINAMIFFSVIVVVISILVTALIIFAVVSRITMPLEKVIHTLQDIAEGEGDLTKSISVNSKDEISDLARYFNSTLEKIRSLITTIKTLTKDLSVIGNELAANMTETSAAINQITANIQSIKGRVVNQSASVTETNATMEQITVNIDKLNGNVENQSVSVSKSSSAIEEMIANIQSVTSTLAKNAGNIKELTEASEVGRNGLQEVSADIQGISRESEGLLEINAVMENIASQTNLLSMNAAIEAAHAGESGKGFAVVADEIRKLAESSEEQSRTIAAVLKKIKGSIDRITRSTDEVLNKFEAIDESVKTVAEQAENIRTAMEEQSVGSQQILEVIGQLNNITTQVKDGSDEMLEGSKEVIMEGKNLEMATLEITAGMNDIASGADEIISAITQVKEISGKNKANINILVQEVSKFKVE